MFLMDTVVVTSPSDLATAAHCEFAFARRLDEKRGLITLEKVERDALEARASELGTVHEKRHLERYREKYTVVELPQSRSNDRDSLRTAAAQTEQAFRDGAEVVFQATFFDESDPLAPMIGYADFIVRQPDGRYRVQDTKLARSVKVTALLQLAAYHEQLARLGIPADDTVELILGTDEISQHSVHDILPVYRVQRQRLVTIAHERVDATTATEWGDPRYSICGRCDYCTSEVEQQRDVLLVAGMRLTQRAKLRDAGIQSIDGLAEAPTKPEGCDIPDRTYGSLHAQAALQVLALDTDTPPFDMFNAHTIGDLPAPDAGDIFFDFEGDPLYSETARGGIRWGIDYLWGLVDRDETFTAFWAHDLEQEKAALEQFLEFVERRRARHPGMHIYHYASYERTHLLSIAARHGVGERIVDGWLHDGLLVDLYPVVKKSVRVGGRSYSIKKLEPLYMGDRLRTGVDNAADSIAEYSRARDEQLAGNETEGQAILDSIADYNTYDCVSTLRLHDWLLARAADAGVQPGAAVTLVERAPFEPSPISVELLDRASKAGAQGDLSGAIAYELASAAVDYHRREDKSFWWAHYARLDYAFNENAIDEWENDRGVFVVTSGRVVSPWALKSTVSYRTLELTGSWAPGSSGTPRDGFTIYDEPVPYIDERLRPNMALAVVAVDPVLDDHRPEVVLITEKCPGGQDPWQRMPVAITPGAPPPTDSLKIAIAEVGTKLAVNGPGSTAIADILWRQPSRTRGGRLELRASAADSIRAVTASVLDLDDSYLAVQGPPGTGKTYLAAHVITALVRDHGWRIGVVAQSHKVVENVLRGIVNNAGLDPALAGKAPADGDDYSDEPFTAIGKNDPLKFADRNPGGYVIGGTAWDFTNLKRFARSQLDLLVIDEAGQFSLAATMAVSVAARNLLLLGDPQQLPQVSQGTHPAPVDQSALGFIADGHAVLGEEFGYFLEESWRMHSSIALPVSELAYDGELRSHPSADQRMLADTAPGLHPEPVPHAGNATRSPEEAARVVQLVKRHLGREWTDPPNRRLDEAATRPCGETDPSTRPLDEAEPTTRPLGEADIIVVTPYNAQVETIRRALDEAGLTGIRVGTVDKFQGQEAVISIVSLAASSAEDVPRGLDFLLSRNRLNVAISRAQWAAYLLYSPDLLDALPAKPEGVAELSRFIRLVS